jgi:hypothetical protein
LSSDLTVMYVTGAQGMYTNGTLVNPVSPRAVRDP